MSIAPELDPTLTEAARQQRYKLVGPANIAHFYHLGTAYEVRRAGYEHVPMLCGLQLAPGEVVPRVPPAEGRARLVCAHCYQLAQQESNKPVGQVSPAVPVVAA